MRVPLGPSVQVQQPCEFGAGGFEGLELGGPEAFDLGGGEGGELGGAAVEVGDGAFVGGGR